MFIRWQRFGIQTDRHYPRSAILKADIAAPPETDAGNFPKLPPLPTLSLKFQVPP